MTKIDELEALERAAREGPWIARGNAVCGGVDGDYAVAECHGPGLLGQQEDAALIAAARNALPALLAIARVAAETAEACEWTDDAMVASGVTCGHCGPCRMSAQLAALAALR